MSLNFLRNMRAGLSLDGLRMRLSHTDALLPLSLLGVITGLASGLVIVLFRVLVEESQALFLSGDTEGYEALAGWARLALPVAGGLLIGLLFHGMAKGQYVSGIVELLERMAYHQGYIPLRRLVLQFLGASISIISGHSVGREGPSVHLGGATGSVIGQRLSLPNNSVRTMVGCGAAAAIGAAFHTPLAGVIFALEVIMMEYTLASFIPVILASVMATAISMMLYGTALEFSVPPMALGTLGELPTMLALGVVAGASSALFIHLVSLTARYSAPVPFWARTTLAGFLVGCIALFYPQVMGIGYDTVNQALLSQIGLSALAGIFLAKLVATALCIGLGIPGGLIGPSLFTGAMLGGLVGGAGQMLASGLATDSGLYALLGMGAMMGATLQAPLAALVAMLELTANPYIILPGMLAIVTAALTSSEVFGKESIFLTLLKARGLDYASDPVLQALQRVGVASAMDRSFARLPRHCDREQADRAMADEPHWILVDDDDNRSLMPAIDLARALQESEALECDLMSIPAKRQQVATVHLRATLHEAVNMLDETAAEALVVQRPAAPGIERVYGVLTRDRIEESYRYGRG